MAKKKKILPKNFQQMLAAGDITALKQVFERCELDAYGGYGNGTALFFPEIPNELAHWLVEQGADLNARDRWDNTPLCEQAGLWDGKVRLLLELGADPNLACGSNHMTALHYAAEGARTEHVRALLEYGADVNALSGHNPQNGKTPLSYALATAHNAELQEVAETAELLLAAGATVTPDMPVSVQGIGQQFEFSRDSFNKELLADAESGLLRLYQLFGVEPVAKRLTHDGLSPITVSATGWMEQHRELWQLLVPSYGAAKTVQGEVIRITGRVAYEISRNGGMNWGREYRKMLDALPGYLTMGSPLPEAMLAEARAHVATIRPSGATLYNELNRLNELAVLWVLANPQPIAL